MGDSAFEFLSVDSLAGRVEDGMLVAMPADYRGSPTRAALALAARPARRLRLVGVPTGGIAFDILIGAGCAMEIEAGGVSLGEYGLAPRFCAAVSEGAITMKDATCPAIYAGLRASQQGVPFMPIRGILESDLEKFRQDWTRMQNPYGTGEEDPVLLVPAIKPDITLIHAEKADRNGNVWIGIDRDQMLMAHAARQTLVTVERIVDKDLLADPESAAGTIPALYISAIAEAPSGAWPAGMAGLYPPDGEALESYARAAKSQAGFDRWFGEQMNEALPA